MNQQPETNEDPVDGTVPPPPYTDDPSQHRLYPHMTTTITDDDEPLHSSPMNGLTKPVSTIIAQSSFNNNNAHNLDHDDGHETMVADVFSELSQLLQDKNGRLTWKEMARWVKYEENVEQNGTRWSKPYVSTVNVAAFIEFKQALRNGATVLDSNAETLEQLVEEFGRLLDNQATRDEINQIIQVLSLQKSHQFQTKRSLMRSFADMHNNSSNSFLKLISRSSSKVNCTTVNESSMIPADSSLMKQSHSSSNSDIDDNLSDDKSKTDSSSNLQQISEPKEKPVSDSHKFNNAFMKKLPENVVSNNILIGEVDFLSSPISGFFRLRKPSLLGNMTEVSVPSKFVFVYLGPKIPLTSMSYTQIGRAFATMMSDSFFRKIAFQAQNVESLILAVDDFLNESPVLPPNLWDPSTRIEPPGVTPESATRKQQKVQLLTQDFSKNGSQQTISTEPERDCNGTGGTTTQSYYNQSFFLDNGDTEVDKEEAALPIGNDLIMKNSFACYIQEKIDPFDSDDEEELERRRNGLVRSGRLFGGLVDDVKRKLPHYKSDFIDAFSLQSMASVIFLYFACLTPIITFGGLLGDATENHIATMESLVCGCLCGIVYGFLSGQPLTILSSTGPVLVFETIVYDFSRSYGWDYLAVRFWIGFWTATILLLFVAFDASYFVCYITRFTEENFASLISFIFMWKAIEKLWHVNDNYPIHLHPNQPIDYECFCLGNDSELGFMLQSQNKTNILGREACLHSGGRLQGPGCQVPEYMPDVFLFSIISLAVTYIVSVKLKAFNNSLYFTSQIRQTISDFAVPIAIAMMTIIDSFSGLPTPKLQVPNEFKPTLSTRTSWLVNPFSSQNPIWLPAASFFPAILATILIFMDQQITAVIVNRKENKLKKGCGYHLDLFILCILIYICSTFGLPWFVAATVLSITHVNSLKMLSQTTAPGDRPKFLGVREQRVTQIIIFVLCGLSIFFTSVLQRIPMPVLYGVFLYMGISSLKGSQFIDRIAIMFMSQKYQPDFIFLRQIKLYRIHLFTIIQLICFIFLWVVKSYKPISITFPLMLVVILAVRKLLDYVFTQQELKILDDKMPESKRKKKERTKARLSAIKNNIPIDGSMETNEKK